MMIRPDGSGVETPHRCPPRSRGRKLSEDAARGIRDLLYSLLLDTFSLTPADATRVMSGGLSRIQVWRRRQELTPLVEEHGVLPLIDALVKESRFG